MKNLNYTKVEREEKIIWWSTISNILWDINQWKLRINYHILKTGEVVPKKVQSIKDSTS